MKKAFIPLLAFSFLLISQSASACTGLVVPDGERVLVGNNEDWFNPRTKIWFVPPFMDRYGGVFFGFDNLLPQGGMNQAGLFFDGFALKPKEVVEPEGKPRIKGHPIKEMMATCGTVAEALALIDRHSRYFMFRSQLLIADATGDAAIIEGNAVVRKQGDYQIVTNFRQSETDPDKISCWRYLTAHKLLADCQGDRQRCLKNILDATHQEGDYPTLYSNIYDLKAKRVYVFHFHNFEEEVVIDLEEELERKPGVRDLPTLFSPNTEAQSYNARYTDLKQEYVHEAPRFVVRYPQVYAIDEPLDDSQVFLAKGRIGQVPVLTIFVTPADADMPLSMVGGNFYAPRLRELGTKVTILSNRPATLADGSEAYETRIKWRWEGRTKINSLVLSAIREDNLVNVALHHTGELEYLKHIPYSLSFE